MKSWRDWKLFSGKFSDRVHNEKLFTIQLVDNFEEIISSCRGTTITHRYEMENPDIHIYTLDIPSGPTLEVFRFLPDEKGRKHYDSEAWIEFKDKTYRFIAEKDDYVNETDMTTYVVGDKALNKITDIMIGEYEKQTKSKRALFKPLNRPPKSPTDLSMAAEALYNANNTKT
jgi:hypothetical protein